jgi:diguanylate cyclase (GGDEF)-like protein/PAS domain S-box-containing protein
MGNDGDTDWRAVIDRIRPGIVLYDLDGSVLECNPAAGRLLGITCDGVADWATVREDDTPWPHDEHPHREVLRTGVEIVGAMMGVARPDGEIWLRVHAAPTHDDDGVLLGVMVTLIEITTARAETVRRRAVEEILVRSNELARQTLDALDQGVVLAEDSGYIRLANRAAETLLGYTAEELADRWRSGEWETFDEHGAPIPLEQRPMVRAIHGGERISGEIVGWRHRDGHIVLLRLTVVPGSNSLDNLVVAFTDVTAEHRSRHELERYEHLFTHANDIIVIIDVTGQVMYTSPSTQRLLGYPVGYELPGGILALVHPDDLSAAAFELRALIDGTSDGNTPFLVRVRHASGELRYLECVGANLLDKPAVGGVVLTARDATERMRLTEQLEHQATHDTLTDLANRRTLELRLEEALARASRANGMIALCFIDLDRFKGVNDTRGHPAGDALLVALAAQIRKGVRSSDLPARVGGDEFVVLLDPIDGAGQALAAATRLRNLILDVDDSEFPIGVSMGLAISENGDSPTVLVSRADAALYRAKARGDSSIELALGEGFVASTLP